MKYLKIIGLVLLVIILAAVAWLYSLSMSKPQGIEGEKAEQLTDAMLQAVGYESFKGIKEISWTFRGKHHHEWDKSKRQVRVKWDENEVLLDFRNQHDVIFPEDGGSELIEEAIAHFYNDSFWLIAPFKIRDEGTSRFYVETDDGPGIFVQYASGGVTPGDSYLWVLGEDSKPKYWRLWTSNVSINGLKFKWSDWQNHDGVWMAPTHPGPGPLSIDITNLKVVR